LADVVRGRLARQKEQELMKLGDYATTFTHLDFHLGNTNSVIHPRMEEDS